MRWKKRLKIYENKALMSWSQYFYSQKIRDKLTRGFSRCYIKCNLDGIVKGVRRIMLAKSILKIISKKYEKTDKKNAFTHCVVRMYFILQVFLFALGANWEKLNLQNFTKNTIGRISLVWSLYSKGTPLHIADVQPMFPGMSKNKIYEVINFRKKSTPMGKTSEFFSIHMREIMEDLHKNL